MKDMQNMYLCGGTFFFLLLQARKAKVSSPRDRLNGKEEYLADRYVMDGLVYAVTGRRNPSIDGSTMKKDTSLYRECKISGSENIPFNDTAVSTTYSMNIGNKNPDILNRMTEFVDTYIDSEMDEWLVRALLDIIEVDEIPKDAKFLVTADGLPITKTELLATDHIELQPFLMGILLFILQYRAENKDGQATLEILGSKGTAKQERKFTNPLVGTQHHGKIAVNRIEVASIATDENDTESAEATPHNPFIKYLDVATAYFSTKKTLLYAEKPHPFYDLYVCNDIQYKKFRATGIRDPKEEKIISNVTIEKLEAESKYVIIQGTGGIGKSMLLTHLFLSSADSKERDARIPFLLCLKDYKDSTCGIIDFIWKSLIEYDSQIKQSDIILALNEKKIVLLLDGLDEIQTSIKDAFEQDLTAFIKSYPGNMIVMTSRPVYSFLSYAKFSIFNIQELTKKQAIELVEKLEFWDVEGKNSFLNALNSSLYNTHRQFASNPLLLTIMLMTYSSFGEVPAKMHVFYSKAYETMARLHDASKGSFKRPLHTNLTPEEFAKYFSEFCARTYMKEILEFDQLTFDAYMNKVLNHALPKHKKIAPRDFLLDLTDNLCIMYCEGNHYYFIHRSFQEYFAAVYFASEYDANLSKVGDFFESMINRSYSDRTFDMLYDMIPEKIERFVFLPYLEKLISNCSQNVEDEYWRFLEQMYPYLTYAEGNTEEIFFNEPESFLYGFIVKVKDLNDELEIDDVKWPPQIYDLPKKVWVEVYSEFLSEDSYRRYDNPDQIPECALSSVSVVEEDIVPYEYANYFGEPEQEGVSIEIDIQELCAHPYLYNDLRTHMEKLDFPLFREYQKVKQYYADLKSQTKSAVEADALFDD